MTKKRRPYVGVHHIMSDQQQVIGERRVVFHAADKPTQLDYPEYNYVIGPFKTARGAKWMRDFGRNNPHARNVAEAERLAKHHEQQPLTIGE